MAFLLFAVPPLFALLGDAEPAAVALGVALLISVTSHIAPTGRGAPQPSSST